MPELPEVETTCRGIRPYIQGKAISTIIIRQRQLRWLIPDDFQSQLEGQTIQSVRRRGKYCLLDTSADLIIIIHLGMSGSLRIVDDQQPIGKHDHVDVVFDPQTILRFNDPRKFGAVLYTSKLLGQHRLFSHLGPEPLADEFTGEILYQQAKGKKIAVKTFIMDGRYVVGVGNIYANEALFKAGIHPQRAAGQISLKRYQRLVQHIKETLQQAIEQGGTTLKDFTDADGKPGYFQQSLSVYGRENKNCPRCESPIKHKKIAQRASFYCCHCQH